MLIVYVTEGEAGQGGRGLQRRLRRREELSQDGRKGKTEDGEGETWDRHCHADCKRRGPHKRLIQCIREICF